MLYFKDVPVVIEPGVGALEVAVMSVTPGSERLFYVAFERVLPTAENAAQLPFIVSSANPHVFSMYADLERSPFLLVYNMIGKLASVYTREDNKQRSWVRNDAASEQVGETITQFSVRFSFNSLRERGVFLDTLDDVINNYSKNNKIKKSLVVTLLDSLISSDFGPVVLPVAMAKKAVM